MKQFYCSVLIVSLCTLAYGQNETFSKMGLSSDDARDGILDAVITGYCPTNLVKSAFLNAPVPTRIVWIKALFSWARTYVQNVTFLDEYQKRREENRPELDKQELSYSQAQSKQLDEFDNTIKEMKKNLGLYPPDMRKQMEETIKELEKQQLEQRQNAEFQEMMKKGYEEQKKQKQLDDQRRLQNFEESFPSDPRKLIARHLKTFLELSAQVDFSARLIDKDGIKVFANPQYESQSKEWKLCFRAGKETVEAARNEAKAWLLQLEK